MNVLHEYICVRVHVISIYSVVTVCTKLDALSELGCIYFDFPLTLNHITFLIHVG